MLLATTAESWRRAVVHWLASAVKSHRHALAEGAGEKRSSGRLLYANFGLKADNASSPKGATS
jgi:hypothetical protein